MAKITAKEVTNGMMFQLEKEYEYGFCWEKGKDFLATTCNPPLKSEILVMKATYKDSGIQFIDFKIKGDPKEYTTHWSTFKNNTKFLSGVAAPKAGVVVTSTGPYAGFDLALKYTEVHNLTDFVYFTVDIGFVGTFTGAKKLSTKMINEIKNAPGFADKCKEILREHLKSREAEIKDYIAKADLAKIKKSWKREVGAPVHVHYKAGKIEFEFMLTDNFDAVIQNMEGQVDYFVKQKTTNVRFYKEKY